MEWREYQAAAAFYKGRKAKRSHVPLMQHIDEARLGLSQPRVAQLVELAGSQRAK